MEASLTAVRADVADLEVRSLDENGLGAVDDAALKLGEACDSRESAAPDGELCRH
jgi:hypothetical protein